VRAAVVGLGRMGRFYAQVVASLAPTVELVAVVDPDAAARAAVQSACGVEQSYAESAALLERSDVHAVIVATPTNTHADVVMRSAAAGKAIFCEKPLALSLAQTRATLAAVERAGVRLQVGFMRRFDPAYQRARALIEAGQIGHPVTFKSVGRDPSCPPLEYADPAHSGGLIVDMGIHDFDLARWLMASEVQHVSAAGGLLVCQELDQVGDIDNAVINLGFASGAIGNVEVSRTARYGYDIRTEILGSDGALRVGGAVSASGDDVELLGPQTVDTDQAPHFIRRFGRAYRAQILHFVECIKHQRPPDVGGPDALAAIQIAEAATLSLRTRQPISLTNLEVNAGA